MKIQAVSLSVLIMLLTGCSLEATLIGSKEDPIEKNSQGPYDFISGEVVTTTHGRAGYQVRAVFGEISEETTSKNGNGWTVEGVFYE